MSTGWESIRQGNKKPRKPQLCGTEFSFLSSVTNQRRLVNYQSPRRRRRQSINRESSYIEFSQMAKAWAIELLRNSLCLYTVILWSWIFAWSHWLMIFLVPWNFNFVSNFCTCILEQVGLSAVKLKLKAQNSSHFMRSTALGSQAFEACNWPFFNRSVFAFFHEANCKRSLKIAE